MPRNPSAGYDARMKYKSEDWYEPEEADVAMALKDYKGLLTSPDEVDLQDFMPTFRLYYLYREYMLRQNLSLEPREVLGPKKFGAALAQVFPHLQDRERSSQTGRLIRPHRTRARYHGKTVWGYLGIKGPDSIRVYGERGRPLNVNRKNLNIDPVSEAPTSRDTRW